jgi:hypothetical protein
MLCPCLSPEGKLSVPSICFPFAFAERCRNVVSDSKHILQFSRWKVFADLSSSFNRRFNLRGTVFSAILLPLIFKFGVEKSRIFMLAIFAAPTAAVIVLDKAGYHCPPTDRRNYSLWHCLDHHPDLLSFLSAIGKNLQRKGSLSLSQTAPQSA